MEAKHMCVNNGKVQLGTEIIHRASERDTQRDRKREKTNLFLIWN